MTIHLFLHHRELPTLFAARPQLEEGEAAIGAPALPAGRLSDVAFATP
jgi:hypothetical protein